MEYTPIQLNCEGVVEEHMVQQVPRIGEQVTIAGASSGASGPNNAGVYKVIDVQHHFVSTRGSQIIVYCEKTNGF